MDLENFMINLLSSMGKVDFGTVLSLIGISFLVFWVVVIGWVWTDSGERTRGWSFRVLSVLIVTFLFIPGLIIYLLIRPKASIEEIYWADLERRYLKYETAELGDCSNCGFQLQPGFIVCPQCGETIKEKCGKCGVYVDKTWRFCPSCGNVRMSEQQAQVEIAENQVSPAVMQEAIESTKEEIVEKVESGMTRYAVKTGFITKFNTLKDSIKSGISNLNTQNKGSNSEVSSTENVAVPEVVDLTRRSKKRKNKSKKKK